MNTSHADPYAGQYPPPPPLNDANPQYFDKSQPVYHDVHHSMPQEHGYSDVHNSVPHVSFEQDHYTPPPLHEAVYTPPVQAHHSRPPVLYDEEAHTSHNQSSLEDYLKTEREEYMRKQPNTYNDTEKNTEEYQELLIDSEKPLGRKERKQMKKQKEKEEAIRMQYQPHVTRPTVAPENEADSYRFNQNKNNNGRSCCCCCYNPALTCCSCFLMLINILFLAGGIALMIASKVVADKCNSECGQVYETAQEACGKLCSKVVHDVMLYGGAAVTGLAGIAIIWRAVMWTCAGYSKR
ncbi:hypothetical protein BY458DRAFT_433294 [Sporodiniella umbellata]|nr:hypothetical protein BY458DRAFT_433294 [Sporodiniella umbellata]